MFQVDRVQDFVHKSWPKWEQPTPPAKRITPTFPQRSRNVRTTEDGMTLARCFGKSVYMRHFQTPICLCIELDWSLILYWIFFMISWIGEKFLDVHLWCVWENLAFWALSVSRVWCVCVCVAKMFQRFCHEMLNDCKQSHHTKWMSTKELINLNQCIWTRFTLKCAMSWQSTMYMVCLQNLQVPYMGKTQVWCWSSYNNRAHKSFGLMKRNQNLKFSRETSLEVMYFCLGPGCCSQHLLRCTFINNKR